MVLYERIEYITFQPNIQGLITIFDRSRNDHSPFYLKLINSYVGEVFNNNSVNYWKENSFA